MGTSSEVSSIATGRVRDWVDLVSAGWGVVIVAGVYVDGWTHVHVGRLDTFFTPSHALLYSGFVASSGWIGWMIWRRSRETIIERSVILPGYGLGVGGIVVFGLGGISDLVWHQLFGIEVGIDALVSPSHLLLLGWGLLLLTCAARSDLLARPREAAGWPAILAVASSSALVGLFLSYVSVFVMPESTKPLTSIAEGAPGHETAELPAAAGLGGYLITAALLVVPFLILSRGRPVRPGALTVITSAVALPGVALSDAAYLVPALSAVAAVALLDGASAVWQPGPRIVAAILPAVAFVGQIAGLALIGRLGWPPALWVGIVLLSGMLGLILSLLSDASPTSFDAQRQIRVGRNCGATSSDRANTRSRPGGSIRP